MTKEKIMAKRIIPPEYEGREQAYIKHYLLKTYLTRLFMIVGQRKSKVINYVDGFAGPWKDDSDELSGTSIGIALQAAIDCRKTLEEKFPVEPPEFRILYNEKERDAFVRLEHFVSRNQEHEGISVECMQGDFSEQIEEIRKWTKGEFTFFFLDPKGWKGIDGDTLEPLLSLPKAEFLVNLMYDFINRFVELDGNNGEYMSRLLGKPMHFDETVSSEERSDQIANAYMENTNRFYRGRVAKIPVLMPDKNRILYYLVYFTRHERGIVTFKEQAERTDWIQRVSRNEMRLRKQMESSGTLSLFDENEVFLENIELTKPQDNSEGAKQYLLDAMREKPLRIDMKKMASILESTDFFPSDLQSAMGQLLKSGRVENLSANASKRRTRFIHPEEKEIWRLKTS